MTKDRVKIKHVKFGSAVLIASKTVMSISAEINKNIEVEFEPALNIYHCYDLKDDRKVFVHATNVQYSEPYAPNDIEETNVHELGQDDETQPVSDDVEPQPRRRGRPRTEAA